MKNIICITPIIISLVLCTGGCARFRNISVYTPEKQLIIVQKGYLSRSKELNEMLVQQKSDFSQGKDLKCIGTGEIVQEVASKKNRNLYDEARLLNTYSTLFHYYTPVSEETAFIATEKRNLTLLKLVRQKLSKIKRTGQREDQLLLMINQRLCGLQLEEFNQLVHRLSTTASRNKILKGVWQ